MCGFMFGLTLPSTKALLFENGGEAYVGAMVAFAFLAAASIFILTLTLTLSNHTFVGFR